MSAGTFLDVVTILSGVMMLCVAFVILYNKYPDILQELRFLFSGSNLPTAEERRAQILAELEKAKQKDSEPADCRRETTPHSPSDQSRPLSVATGSVYLESVVNSPCSPRALGRMLNDTPPIQEEDEEDIEDEEDDDLDDVSMDYSKESFSSYAKVNRTRASNMMHETETEVGIEHSNYNFSFLYDNITITSNRPNQHAVENRGDVESAISEEDSALDSDQIDLELHEAGEEVCILRSRSSESAVADIMETNHSVSIMNTPSPLANHHHHFGKAATNASKSTIESSAISKLSGTTTIASNNSSHLRRLQDSPSEPTSKDSFSPLARRNVTFSSQLLEEDSLEYSKQNTTVDTTALSKRKPSVTIITSESILSLDEERGEKEITPCTAATEGMWSQSASLTPQTRDGMDCDLESMVSGYSLPSDESPYDHKSRMLSPENHDVHVCKSSSCTLCRCPSKNTPTFLSTQKVVSGGNYKLPFLPSRWWDYQQRSSITGQTSKNVSSLPVQRRQPATRVSNDAEDHPFDEA